MYCFMHCKWYCLLAREVLHHSDSDDKSCDRKCWEATLQLLFRQVEDIFVERSFKNIRTSKMSINKTVSDSSHSYCSKTDTSIDKISSHNDTIKCVALCILCV